MTQRTNRAKVYRLSLCALLLSMMLILGYVENMFPINVGVPGIKLGLSNGVLIFAVYMLDLPTAFVLMCMKVLLSGVLFSGPSAMMYGFAGGLLSLSCMVLLSRVKNVPVPAVGILGGVMHNVGQVSLSLLILRVPVVSMLGYMAFLCAVGGICGLLTGVCARSVMAHMKHTPWKKPASGRVSAAGGITAAVVVILAGVLCWIGLVSQTPSAPQSPETPSVTWVSDTPALDNLPVLPR